MNQNTGNLHTIEEAIQDIQAGKVLIVVDNEDRENEGDFICAAEKITPEIINFMATHGRGLICAPLDENRADELDLPLMVSSNTAFHETAFTVSVDLIGQGCTTGISAHDRSKCIKALTMPETKATDFAKPDISFHSEQRQEGCSDAMAIPKLLLTWLNWQVYTRRESSSRSLIKMVLWPACLS